MTLEKKTRVIIEDDSEDRSEILIKENKEDLQPVYPKVWFTYDVVLSYLATYWTHGLGEATQMQRCLIALFIMTCSVILQHFYFSAGSLDRPVSGQHKVDRWWHIAIAHAGNIIFFWEFVHGLYRQFVDWYTSPDSTVLGLVSSLAIGFYLTLWLSDVIAGIVHWGGDTLELYFFQYHHRDSRYMTRQSYVHHTWDTFLLAFVLSYSVLPFLRTTLLGRAVRIIAAQTNECHMWAHCSSRERPALVQLLQRWNLILSWKAHADHHKPPHLIDYCVFNGWANPVMNRILPGPLTNFLCWVKTTDNFKRFKEFCESI